MLILDEPTAVLTPQDVRALFATVERLRGAGLGVLLVSHKLREVAEISDRVVVLRRGRLVGERVTSEVRAEELAGLMMGSVDRSAGRRGDGRCGGAVARRRRAGPGTRPVDRRRARGAGAGRRHA